MTVDELRIRGAEPDDLPAILRLLDQDSFRYFGETPLEPSERQRAALQDIAQDPMQDLLVGELDGRVIATCQVTWMRMLVANGGLFCQVEAVRTEASLRGRGIGAALMEHVEAEAARRGAARVQLTSNVERPDAHRFYERLGYVASHVGMKKYL